MALTYEDAKSKQIINASTVEIKGVPLTLNDSQYPKHLAILHCKCKECDDDCDKSIVFIPKEGINSETKTKKKDTEGNSVYSYKVFRGVKLVVELSMTLDSEVFVENESPNYYGRYENPFGSSIFPFHVNTDSCNWIFNMLLRKTMELAIMEEEERGYTPEANELRKDIKDLKDDYKRNNCGSALGMSRI